MIQDQDDTITTLHGEWFMLSTYNVRTVYSTAHLHALLEVAGCIMSDVIATQKTKARKNVRRHL